MKLSALDAAYQVLKASGKPMEIRELTRQILEQGLWETKGKTPWDTVAAQMYTELNRLGAKSRFVKAGKGQVWGAAGVVSAYKAGPKPKMAKDSTPKMTFLNAAEYVLKSQSKKAPMHYEAITKIALEKHLLATSGKTPDATMGAQIYEDIKRSRRKGELPRFDLCKGMVSLTAWQKTGINLHIDQHRKDIGKQIRAKLQKMSPERFEQFAAAFLTGLGIENVKTTRLVGDKGVDARGTMIFAGAIKTKMAVQVKRWKYNVGAPIVRELRGSITTEERGMIITLGDFAAGAKAEAEAPGKAPIALLNGERMIDLMLENRIGVKPEEATLFEIDDEFFA